ncbi:MAG: FliI/YscN family ATPase [Oscillospiraceae bacterium]|jgi:flagellum-specific ATP synthase|nr:FliI/YscN family ATPase [Oscillospiraceae bacterium]
MLDIEAAGAKIASLDTRRYTGRVVKIVGLAVEATSPSARVGDIVTIRMPRGNRSVDAEIVGFKDSLAQLMPYGSLDGAGLGCAVEYSDRTLTIPVGESFLGRVLDPLGRPMDDKSAPEPAAWYPADSEPRNPLKRERIHSALPLGVRAIDGMLTAGVGQRLGIFAGSGVGKSTLLGMMARRSDAEVNVIVLIGERGREVLDFIERDLGDGLAKSVLIVATSDQPALLRLKSALTGSAVAEYFRDRGKNVLLMMDSLTRFAMAQREIGMAMGEPPVSRGYPPSVYTLMPRLLERAGTSERGSVTGLYTVLVEGDDLNEPVSDTARGILDGHIVLSRQIANTRYPPIDVLASVSRVMPDVVTPEHLENAQELRRLISIYGEAEDLINIGAYREGANAEIDRAVKLRSGITEFLRQSANEEAGFETTLDRMKAIAES